MRQPATRLQVSGHRFLTRRMTHALVRGDVRMFDDPLRAQSLSMLVGTVLATVGIAVCAVIAVLRPAGDIGDASVVMVGQTGALYVRVDDTLHPVVNLTSAWLITGRPVPPRVVSQSAVDARPRGATMGIPAAPQHISPGAPAESAMVCDEGGNSTVSIGVPADAVTVPQLPVLATPRGANPALTYLLYGGRKARVDLRHPAVVRALRLDGVPPIPLSPAVLAALPEAPAIVPPHIPDRGSPGPGPLHAYSVGSVLTVPRAGRVDEEFVVLGGGLQRIGEVAADLIRYTDGRLGAHMPTVPPDILGAVPVLDSLPVGSYPERAGVTRARVVCARWRSRAEASGAHSTVVVADGTPVAGAALAQADGAGPAVDAVALAGGGTLLVRSVALGGGADDAGPLFVLSDTGALFCLENADTATRLGLIPPGSAIPWPILAVLPRGPDLSVRAASVAGDVLVARP
ncbi:MAG: type VII secretion protein EccB [Actinomycetota bacterium]